MPRKADAGRSCLTIERAAPVTCMFVRARRRRPLTATEPPTAAEPTPCRPRPRPNPRARAEGFARIEGGQGPAARAWRVNLRALIVLGLALAAVVAAVVAVQVVQGRRGRTVLLDPGPRPWPPPGRTTTSRCPTSRNTWPATPATSRPWTCAARSWPASARSPEQLSEAIRSGEAALRLEPDRDVAAGPGPAPPPGRRLPEDRPDGPGLRAQVRPGRGDRQRAGRHHGHGRRPAAPRPGPGAAGHAGDPEPVRPRPPRGSSRPAPWSPGTSAAAERLARLYFVMKQPAKADAVLEALLKANPTPAAYLAAARFHAGRGGRRRGLGPLGRGAGVARKVDELIKKAVAVAPQRPERPPGGGRAWRWRPRSPPRPPTHLDQVPEKDRQSYRYLTLRGVVALYENQAADAIESWSRGLLNTGGGEAELSWRLAFVLLQLGRVDEAEPLISSTAGSSATRAARRRRRAAGGPLPGGPEAPEAQPADRGHRRAGEGPADDPGLAQAPVLLHPGQRLRGDPRRRQGDGGLRARRSRPTPSSPPPGWPAPACSRPPAGSTRPARRSATAWPRWATTPAC